mmetsp:Transcript_60874/g.199329  ORF Transcript_60874/g.199329 Transcript_60874/m.199329 type:complete len:219 (+) Transcript_60874:448-1104(+)
MSRAPRARRGRASGPISNPRANPLRTEAPSLVRPRCRPTTSQRIGAAPQRFRDRWRGQQQTWREHSSSLAALSRECLLNPQASSPQNQRAQAETHSAREWFSSDCSCSCRGRRRRHAHYWCARLLSLPKAPRNTSACPRMCRTGPRAARRPRRVGRRGRRAAPPGGATWRPPLRPAPADLHTLPPRSPHNAAAPRNSSGLPAPPSRGPSPSRAGRARP